MLHRPIHRGRPVLRWCPPETLPLPAAPPATASAGEKESPVAAAGSRPNRNAQDAAAPKSSPPADVPLAHSQTPSAAAVPRLPPCCRTPAPAPLPLLSTIAADSPQSAAATAAL